MDEWKDPARLIVTNGDCAADLFRSFGFRGPILPWRDALHDGPVPDLPLEQLSDVRAGFIHERGWGQLAEVRLQFQERDRLLMESELFEETVLWFEHDLYDQFQLLQTIHSLAPRIPSPRISAVFSRPHITSFDLARTSELFQARKPLTGSQAELACELWVAFTRGDYRRLERAARSEDSALPNLAPALHRWLEDFPWVTHGLTRTESQILGKIDEYQRLDPVDLFQKTQQLEEDRFLGDSSFFSYLEDLVDRRILEVEDADLFLPPWKLPEDFDFRSQSLVLSPLGALLQEQGRFPSSEMSSPFSGWRGGGKVCSDNPWWWDPVRQQLVR